MQSWTTCITRLYLLQIVVINNMNRKNRMTQFIKKFRKDFKDEYYTNDYDDISEKVREEDRDIEDFENFVETLNEILFETKSKSKK